MTPHVLTGLFIFALGLAATIGSRNLTAGLSYGEPGPGLFPLLIGLALMACGLAETLSAWRDRKPDSGPFWQRQELRSLALLACLALYAALLGKAPYLPLTAAFVLITAWLMGQARWWENALVSAGLAGLFFAVFKVWLRLPLP